MGKETRPNRQSIRLKKWDYTSGCYFVTMNTHQSRALFGAIVNGKMVLSEAGRIAEEEWRKSAVIREGIELDEFVIMPNHVHGIVRLQGLDASSPCLPQFGKPQAGALGTFVGAYKAAVTREIRRRGLMLQARSLIWHRNYWDVIVRDEQALAGIRKYIRFNPQNYDVMMKVGDPQFVGNEKLLELPKTGFLASRGANALHGRLPVKRGEAVISGFLSPMERAVFKAGLAQKRPLIWVKPWGLDSSEGLPFQTRAALDDGRLLIVSPFNDAMNAPSVRRAAWCNQYVLAHYDRMVVGSLNPGGMLACILSESDPEMDIVYL
jgi:REP element-mobilizing transposase RayT